MLRFISVTVIVVFVAMWAAGETPRSLRAKALASQAEHTSFLEAGGEQSDWGER